MRNLLPKLEVIDPILVRAAGEHRCVPRRGYRHETGSGNQLWALLCLFLIIVSISTLEKPLSKIDQSRDDWVDIYRVLPYVLFPPISDQLLVYSRSARNPELLDIMRDLTFEFVLAHIQRYRRIDNTGGEVVNHNFSR